MSTRLRNLWDSVNGSFWFIPTLMTVAAAILSFVFVTLDQSLTNELNYIFGYNRGPEGARSLLSTVAGSVITVAGVTFSITIAALSLASNQFGPRLLRNFMRDRGNQVVLGTFIATFLYCLLVLRTVNGSQENSFVPHIAVTFGVLLATASLGVLIYFVNHVATLIQAEDVVDTVSKELHHTIDYLFPEKLGHPPPDEKREKAEAELLPADFEKYSRTVKAPDEGYLQALDTEKLMGLANQHDLICRVLHRPGEFIIKGMEILQVWPGEKVTDELSSQLDKAFITGSFRSTTQDVEFAINQLVEVALRALSPSINDPFTAINCIDRLGAGISHIGERSMPSAYRYQDGKKLRIIVQPLTKAELVELAFDQLREAASFQARVVTRLLELICQLVKQTSDQELQTALVKEASLIERAGNKNLTEETDREKVTSRYQAILNNVVSQSLEQNL